MVHSVMPDDRYRCTSIDQGDRCHLFEHDDDQDIAMISHPVQASRASRRSYRPLPAPEFRTWGQPWTGPTPGESPLRWAPTMAPN
jgi:hypothetical protein